MVAYLFGGGCVDDVHQSVGVSGQVERSLREISVLISRCQGYKRVIKVIQYLPCYITRSEGSS